MREQCLFAELSATLLVPTTHLLHLVCLENGSYLPLPLSDLEIIINLLGTLANDENATDKISPKFLLNWKNSAKIRLKWPISTQYWEKYGKFQLKFSKIGQI